MIVTQSHIFPPAQGIFIAVEGVNGAGKSTLISAIEKHLQAKGRTSLCTKEPGATALGKSLRSMLLETRPAHLVSRAELLLFAADRAQHVEEVIRPALAAGQVVISDRYYFSTTAFQGYGRGLDHTLVQTINEIAIADVRPHLAILLDLPAEEGLARIRANQTRAAEKDAFEKEPLEFQARIREGFLAIAKEAPEPFAVIDARTSAAEIVAACLPYIDSVLGNSK